MAHRKAVNNHAPFGMGRQATFYAFAEKVR
jgi:hypothetical protein